MRGWAPRIAGVFLLVLSPGGLLADTAETEFRLKSINVPPELRARIHKAIDAGVRYLEKRQNPDGDGMFTFGPNPDQSPGLTALCGLACRHAGTPEGKRVAARAVGWLAPDRGRLRREATKQVYNLSLSILLLELVGLEPAHLQELAQDLTDSQSPGIGWWGYVTVNSPRVRRLPGAPPTGLDELPDISNTQFAGLGLWAAHIRGARIDREVWASHLRGLAKTQTPSGSWGYAPGRTSEYRPYSCATFMGVANLALCVSALGGISKVPERDRDRATAALAAAKRALARDGTALLESLGAAEPRGGQQRVQGEPDNYELFAFEKACVFLGVEKIGGYPWYAVGATSLLNAQNADGGWGKRIDRTMGKELSAVTISPESRAEDTAFAILFLTRAPEVHGIATRRPVDFRTESVATADDTGDPSNGPSLDDAAFRDLFTVVFRRYASADTKGREARAADFVNLGVRSIPLLLLRLREEDESARGAAITALRAITGETLDYDPAAASEARAMVVAAWEEWWLARKDRLKPDIEKGRFRE